jgi:hypothetical protein
MPDPNLEQLIAAWLDGRISQADSDTLQQQLRESADARATFREFTKLDAVLREVAGGDAEVNMVRGEHLIRSDADLKQKPKKLNLWKLRAPLWAQLAVVATVLILVGGFAYQLGKGDASQASLPIPAEDNQRDPLAEEIVAEKTIAGYATLRRVAGIQWSHDASAYREGDVLPAGVLEFDDGVAEIDFFCGATLVVEGPAKMDLESDWSVRLLAGRLRANVPPAARGFVVKAADSEIIDLGTEFALEVGPENIRVEVVEGEIKLRGGEHDGDHLVTGEGQSLLGMDAGNNSLQNLSTIGDVQRRHEAAQQQRFARWKATSQQLRSDERLIAYYPIAESKSDRSVPNGAATGHGLDGTLVGLVNHANGRFGSESASLGFGRPGSRVRVRIDGEFAALTFACWVKIDSLEHRYNALFMGDGYENGEPHWQIRDDGRLMFSVMVDDRPGTGEGDAPDARLHRVYFTDPIWDVSKSGQWMHIAAVYDPVARQVTQYVNGAQISSENITPKFFVQTLRIGPAEIGNWGQPFRDSPWFAVRNLNGAIDELAIFDAALNADDIRTLYENGKPFGY